MGGVPCSRISTPHLAPAEALHDHLVRPGHEVQVVHVVELLRDVGSECVPGPARGQPPPRPVIRVRPQEVAHGALVRNLGKVRGRFGEGSGKGVREASIANGDHSRGPMSVGLFENSVLMDRYGWE